MPVSGAYLKLVLRRGKDGVMEIIESLADRFMRHVACSVAVLSVVAGHGDADAADMFVANHSFEAVDTLPVSGI